MSKAEGWLLVEKLFRVFDKDRDGKLNLDELVAFVAQVKKMDVVHVDEGNIVSEMTKQDAEYISFQEFKIWSMDTSGNPEKQATFVDPFGNTDLLPDRFEDPSTMVHKPKSQHPCYTTSYNDLGGRAPSDADMPTKWRGHDGAFTDTFIYNEPGKGMQLNLFHDRSLRCNKTRSNVHSDFDVDWDKKR